MATTMTEKVTVTELSKYGVKVGETYYNWSKQIKENEKGKVVPGGTYDMELYVADSGKKYINSVGGEVVTSTKPQPKTVTPKVTPSVKTETMSKDEWQAKDTRISRQGVIQVAVQVAGSFEDAVILADKMLEFVNRKG